MRDDDYQRTAKALACETKMSEASATRIEDELLTAMSSGGAARSFVRRRYSDERKWLAAAAVVVVAAGSMVLWKLSGLPEQAAPKQVVFGGPSVPEVLPELSPNTTVATSANAPQSARSKRGIHTTLTPPVGRPNGFVELPWTAGLPAFESGEIVRVEVPVASLPAYGFDISRGTNRSVEADVLVGQDGLARAMRLVSNSARSTQ